MNHYFFQTQASYEKIGKSCFSRNIFSHKENLSIDIKNCLKNFSKKNLPEDKRVSLSQILRD